MMNAFFFRMWSEVLYHRSDIGSIVGNTAKSVMLQLECGLSFAEGVSQPVGGKRFFVRSPAGAPV